MSHEGGPEQPQRTVAELLAKYGAESGERAPRRRRRRADDVSDTGAQAIIERVLSESGELQAIRDDMPPPERTSHRRGHSTGQYPRPQRQQEPPPPPRRQPQPSQQLPRPLPAPQPTPKPPPPQPSQPLPRPQQSSGRMPAIARPSEPTTPVRGTPPPPQPSQPLPRPQPSQPMPRPQPSGRMPLPPPPPGSTRERSGVPPAVRSRLDGVEAPPPPPPMPVAPPEPTTEELPRVAGRVPVDGSMTGRRPVPGADSRTRIQPVYPPPRDPYADVPEEDEYPGTDRDDRYDSGEFEPLADEDVREDRDYDGDYDGDLDDLEDDDLDDDDRVRSPAKEWAIMGGQLALGVVGGAAIWLGFNWLWGFMPAAALVAALAVIVGLVLIVRKIRRAEDLQTTFLAVLVGLVVTVSPAALLLLNK